MSDVYVYYFMRPGKAPSKRRATLETIKGIGEPVMESQLVVDHTEVDSNGFLIGWVDNQLQPPDEYWSQIRSLEKRAASRDFEAQGLSESTDGSRQYNLRLESRELRRQAQLLKKHHAELSATAERASIDTQDLGQLESTAWS